ncbi:MAG TPA: hypothetical protein VE959_04290 [Bryobacteraceae bacterium]|nr:hypothetical protein [Bryobacteraceae bacterium]
MTDQDLKQIGDLLGTALAATEQRLEEKFTAGLAAVEQRLEDKFTAAITSAIAASEQRLEDKFTAAITSAIAASEERSQEFARNIETSLLTAFQTYAKGQNARFHTGESTSADLAIRVTALEERVLNLETRRPPR